MVQFHRSRHVLKFEGELTIYHAAEAKLRLQEELSADPALEVDLSGIEEMDTAGAQVLLWLKREGLARGQAIPFTHHSPAVLDVIDLLNLAGVFGDTILIAPSS
jgi:anti-anti-sigma factor